MNKISPLQALSRARWALPPALALGLAACGGGGGGGTPSFSIGGSVSGLNPGATVSLLNNGGNALKVSANGGFKFAAAIPKGGAYAVTVGAQPAGQTCSVAHATGSGVSANVTNVAVTCSVDTYTVGGTVSGLASGQQLTLLDNGTDSLLIQANGPFQFNGPIAAGGAYAVSVGIQPSKQLCSVTNAQGSGVGANVSNVAVACGNHYAYAVDQSTPGSVYQYSLNGDGSLSALSPATVATVGDIPFDMIADPTGTHVYIASEVPGGSRTTYGIYVGTVGANGALTVPLYVDPNPATNPVQVLAMDYTGQYLYGTSMSTGGIYAINQFRIQSNGVPTPLATPSITPAATVTSLTADTQGPYLYAVAPLNNAVLQYDIGTGGALSPMAAASVAAGMGPASLTVDPSGKYAYAVNYGSSTQPPSVSQYTIGSGGALTPMLPASVPVAGGARRMAIDPSGRYAYVVGGNKAVGAVSQYTIGSNGALTPMTPASVPAGATPVFARVDPTGSYLYVTNNANNGISAYKIGPSGLLSPVAGSPFPAGSSPQGLVVH